jgi:hypothetical protein
MRKLTAITTTIAAIAALSAIATTIASAALPEALPTSGNGTGTGGPGTLAVSGGNTITCKKAKDQGRSLEQKPVPAPWTSKNAPSLESSMGTP